MTLSGHIPNVLLQRSLPPLRQPRGGPQSEGFSARCARHQTVMILTLKVRAFESLTQQPWLLGRAGAVLLVEPSAPLGVRPRTAKHKTKTAIYHPPKSGMPYLVVTSSTDGVDVTAVSSKEEARILASKKTLKVLARDEAGENSDERG
jgi:hypothetical protein